MTSRAGIVLESALQSPGVVGAALVDSTGFVIGTASPGEGDLVSSGAAAVEKLRQWTVLGTALALGTPKFLMIEREGSQTPSLTAGEIVLIDAPAFGPLNGLFPGGLCHRCVLHSQRTDQSHGRVPADHRYRKPSAAVRP